MTAPTRRAATRRGDVATARREVAAPAATAIAVESGMRRVFASAIEWPGWCRSGRDEAAALETLASYAPRYARVAREAGVPFPAAIYEGHAVTERLAGNATTDFGAPGAVAKADHRPLAPAEARRLAALVGAAWRVFDGVVASSPAVLRKGPRGGGRDRDKIVDHVLAAEAMYVRKLGIRLPEPQRGDARAIAAMREAIVELLRAARTGKPLVEKGWPPRYAARRIAWHALDHAWEIDDRRA